MGAGTCGSTVRPAPLGGKNRAHPPGKTIPAENDRNGKKHYDARSRNSGRRILAADEPNIASTVLTIGHSTHHLAEFVRLLRTHDVRLLIDVRSIPRSRHNPQFNKESLAKALRSRGIRYRHAPDLGGLRRPAKDSVNTAWRNASFRGYADYMGTEAFARGLEKVIALAQAGEHLALMCAEGAPFRCHRSLIADALLLRGVPVAEITSALRTAPHKLTPFARVRDGQLVYPKEALEP